MNPAVSAPAVDASRRRSRAGYGPAVLAVLVADLMLAPWLAQLPPAQTWILLAQSSICAAAIARASWPALRPVALIAFVFHFSWLTVAPIYQFAHGEAAWHDGGVLYSPYAVPALLLTLLATVVMYAALLGPMPRRHSPRASDASPGAPSVWADPPRRLCVAYIAACLVLAPRAIAAVGGLAGMFESRDTRVEALRWSGLSLTEAGGVGVALVGILPGALATAAAYLALIRVINQVRRGGLTELLAVDVLILVAGLGLAVVFANPFVNTRALSVAALGSLVLVALRPRTGRGGLVTAGVALFGMLIAYPAANAFRGRSVEYATGFEALAGQDFDGYQQVINTVSYVSDLGYAFGRYTMSGSLFFVPRSLWEGKSTPASIDVAQHRGYVFTNLSMPLHSEFYLDFGVIGMCVVLFLIALLARRCDTAWLYKPDSRLAMLAPYACLAAVSMIRGPIGSNGPVYLTNLGLIGFGLYLSRAVREPSRSPSMVTTPRA
jgi:hypothetical protein